MAFGKPRFLYDNLLKKGTVTASADADYPKENLYDGNRSSRWKAPDTIVPRYITFDRGEVTLSNGDLETGDTTGWLTYFGGSASGSFAASSSGPYEGTYKGLVTITAGGADVSNIQIWQDGFTIEEGKTYTAILALKAAAARTVTFSVGMNQPPYTTAHPSLKVFNLTTSWKLFRFTFTSTLSTPDARFNIRCGADTNDVEIDVCDLYEGDELCADFMGILGHNLNTIAAEVTLQGSMNNFTNSWVTGSWLPSSDNLLFEEFRVVANSTFDSWSGGASAAPSGWWLNGSPTIARDNSHHYVGKYSAKLTYGAAVGSLRFSVAGNSLEVAHFAGKTMTLGMWVRCATANCARIGIYDGVGSYDSSYHPGDDTWRWLTVTYTVDADPANLQIYMRVDIAGSANCDGVVFKEGSSVASTDKSDIIPSGRNAARWWRLKITDETGSLSAAPEIGELFIGPGYRLPRWFAEGFNAERDINRHLNTADGGQRETIVHHRRNAYPCTLRNIPINTQQETDYLAWRDAVEDGTPFWLLYDLSGEYKADFVSMIDTRLRGPIRGGRRDFAFTLEEEL